MFFYESTFSKLFPNVRFNEKSKLCVAEIRLAPGQGRVKILYKPPSSHPQIDSLIFYSLILDLSSIPRAREGGPWGVPAPKSDRGSWAQWSQASFFAFFLCFCASSSFFKFFIQNCSFTKVLALRGAHFLF